jgi:hypothetical protein
MIIFINGAFGVGKTTVAERLVERIPNSLLFDAEEVGFFLRRVVAPIEQPDDFQHLPLWRALTVTTARLLQETYGRALIMPMTIWRAAYFDEVLGGLRAFEPALYHFCLTATEETLRARLRGRGDRPEVFAWCWEQARHCLPAFQDPTFAEQIATDGKAPAALVEEILARLPARG